MWRRASFRIPLVGAIATFFFVTLLAFAASGVVHHLTFADIDDELETLSSALASALEREGVSDVSAEALHRGIEGKSVDLRLEHHAALLLSGKRLLAASGELATQARFVDAVALTRRPNGRFTAREPFTQQRRVCRFEVRHLGDSARGATLIVFRSIEPARLALFRLDMALVLLVIASTASSATILFFSVRRALRPVEDVTRLARAAEADDLSQRVRVGGGGEELEQLTEVINSLFARLERSFVAQRRLIADAAHELKTPIAALLAETQEAQRDDTSSADRSDLLASVARTARQLGRQVNDLLMLASVDAVARSRTACDLSAMVRDAVASTAILAAARQSSWTLDLPEPCTVHVNETLLRRVVMNLVTNAIDYSAPASDLRATIACDEREVAIRISDRGPGVAAEDRQRIFERFVRLPSARDTRPEGSGLGLAIVKEVIERFGGRVAVEEREGGGSVFVAWLPRSADGEPSS